MRTMRNLLAKKAVVTVLAVGVSLAAVNAFWGGSTVRSLSLGLAAVRLGLFRNALKNVVCSTTL